MIWIPAIFIHGVQTVLCAGDAWHGTFVDRVDPRRLLDDMVDTKVGKHQDPMAAAKMVSTHRDDI